MAKKQVLFAASEVYPFAKTGGLADVAYSLPRALGERYDVCVVMPLYRSVEREKFGISPLGTTFSISMGETSYTVELYGCRYKGVEYRFVYSPLLCEHEFLYGTPEAGYEDNALRFGLFSHLIARMAGEYDIVHLNDWQCALAALLIKENHPHPPLCVYTIHNLAYQGIFDAASLPQLGVDPSHFTMEGIEFYDRISFMKAGIAYADRVSTVSPSYAREILAPEFGCGLDGFLRVHAAKLSGILNGIDPEHFSPQQDGALAVCYGDAKGKGANKSAFLKSAGLKGAKKPLFVFIGRLTEQKGVSLLIKALPKMAAAECNIAILGDGEAKYCESLVSLAAAHPNLHVTLGYEEEQARRFHAAADFFVMPSLYEPCGLAQMIAFAYGGIPLVHRVGGLADTVRPIERFDPARDAGFGILFKSPTSRSLLGAFNRALELYGEKRFLNTVVNHNMNVDFSWGKSAAEYAALYESDER